MKNSEDPRDDVQIKDICDNDEKPSSPSIIENSPEKVQMKNSEDPRDDVQIKDIWDNDEKPSSPSIIENSPEKEILDYTRILQKAKSQTNVIQLPMDNDNPRSVDELIRTDEPTTSGQRTVSMRRSSSSSSSSSTSSSSSSSTSSDPSGSRSRKKAKPNYNVSPINTEESDVDLSDNDPTYQHIAANRRFRHIPSTSESDSTRSPSRSNTTEVMQSTTPSRKRKRNPSQWKQNRSRLLKNTGKSYISLSKSKKLFPDRSLKPVCQCRLKCFDNLQDKDRQDLFDNYWKMGDINLQRTYIRSCMLEVKPKYKYTNAKKPRLCNTAFYFTVDGKKIRVCKKYFLNTLDVTDRLIRTVKKKTNSQGFVEKDMRGRSENPKKSDPALIQDIKDHINSIPRIESHYLRTQTNREFITDSKSITDLWNDFNKLQKEKNRPEILYWLYLNTFNNEFNIGFFQPKKDRCEICVAYELAPREKKLDLKANYDQHLEEKELCRQQKRRDRENIDTTHICAVFDLQSVMLCPSPSYFYYCSKINCLNFTITELNKKDNDQEDKAAYGNVFCYFWDESEGNRGANEIGSCIYDYLTQVSQNHPNEKVKVTFYSDNCTGQNKNKFIASLYSFAVANLPNIESITHKYLIKGHTQNEADNVHSLIEKAIKKNEKAGPIYIPHQYVTLIKSARKTGKPFIVKEIDHEFFINLKKLQEKWAYNFKENTEKKTVLWGEIKVLHFVKGNTFEIKYKTSYSGEEYGTIDTRNKRKKMINAADVRTERLYPEKLGLKENKKNDLRDLVRKNLIPTYYANFYNSL